MPNFVRRKAMIIRDSGRSSNFITPSFGFGCEYKCSYCYMRRHVKTGLSVATNTQEIIDTIDAHNGNLKWPKEPDQTHDKYYTYDFSCNEDYVKHAQYHDWKMLFDYFKNNDRAMGTAATKYVNEDLLDYNPNRKIRIRFSVMQQKYSNILEPGTSTIADRLKAINKFWIAGYDVHINYSPIIVEEDAGILYQNLFKQVDKYVDDAIKEHVKCEAIFLTHNHDMHEHNMKKESTKQAEDLLWKPKIQEQKTSQYGNVNIRYQYELKRRLIDAWKHSHNAILPWQEIRYIF